ncbi:hypothetical protein PG984_010735 [Apiospora sp. TS-2023a]
MAEAFGILVGAGQITGYVVSLIKLAHNFLDGPELVQGCHNYFTEVRRLADSISNNPSLQAEDIQTQVRSIIAILESTGIEGLLQKSRIR